MGFLSVGTFACKNEFKLFCWSLLKIDSRSSFRNDVTLIKSKLTCDTKRFFSHIFAVIISFCFVQAFKF